MSEGTRQYYDEKWEEYIERNRGKDLSHLYQLFLRHLSGKVVLDVGCGTGRDLKYFSELGYECTGLDFSDKMLELSQANSPGSTLVKVDLRESFGLPRLYDGIWAVASLHHLSKDELRVCLRNLKGKLSPNGVFMVSIKEREIPLDDGRYFCYWSQKRFRESSGISWLRRS